MRLSRGDAQKEVFKVQIAKRSGYPEQGKNVKVSIGAYQAFDENDAVCTEIAQLNGTRLVDYVCDQGELKGEYVKFSSDQTYLTICEAKVFVKAAFGGICQSDEDCGNKMLCESFICRGGGSFCTDTTCKEGEGEIHRSKLRLAVELSQQNSALD